MKVAVFGLGYVGAVSAACLAVNGHDVWGIDIDKTKVDAISRGRSPVVEPGLDELIARGVARGTLHATTSSLVALDQADISLLCVGTPSTAAGGTDLSYLQRAVNDIAEAALVAKPPKSGLHSVVIRSTVPPGTVDDVVTPALAPRLINSRFRVGTAMCPEFLREGSGIVDFFAPALVVVGTANRQVGETMIELFGFLDQQVRIVDVRSAEALKYACNAFHATKVSFANEMARLFRRYGVDSRKVMALLCEDTTSNISPRYLRPGFAFGGSCLPKDLRSLLHLARMNSVDLPLLTGTLLSNDLVISEVIDRVVASDAREVALLGLSFKADTDDLRESPNVELAERLIGKGFNLRIYDPIVNPVSLSGTNRRYVELKLPHLRRLLTDAPLETVRGADIALVSSTDPGVLEALVACPPPQIIDLSGCLDDTAESIPGYEGVGW